MSIDTLNQNVPELSPDDEKKIQGLVDQGAATWADAEYEVLGHPRLTEAAAASRVMGGIVSADQDSTPDLSHDPPGEDSVEVQQEGAALVRAVGDYLRENPDIARLPEEDRSAAIDAFIEDFKKKQNEPSN